MNVSGDKLATCKRCGDDSVYWCKSLRTGRFYLVQVAQDGTTSRNQFHKCQAPVQQPLEATNTMRQSPNYSNCNRCGGIATDTYMGRPFCHSHYQTAMALDPDNKSEADEMAEDAACNSVDSGGTQLDVEQAIDNITRNHELTEHVIRTNRDLMVEQLKRSFDNSPSSVEIKHTSTGITRTVKTIPLDDSTMDMLNKIANEPAPIQTPSKRNPVVTDRVTNQPRNIPCPKCKQANRLTYAELIGKVNCCQ